MSNDLKAMKESFNTLEQYSRRNCVELRGIPMHVKILIILWLKLVRLWG